MNNKYAIMGFMLSLGVLVLSYSNCGPMILDSTRTSTNEELNHYLESNDLVLIDDMVVPAETIQSYNNSLDNGSFNEKVESFVHYKSEPWPNGVLIYKFDSNVKSTWRNLFRTSCELWTKGSSAICREASSTDSYFLQVISDDSDGCWSYVGHSQYASRMRMNLNSKCFQHDYFVIHEIGHAWGLAHEHQRPDRDNYIIVYNDRIKKGYEHSYVKLSNLNQTYGEYDFLSIMHYPDYSYSVNNQPVMVSRKGYPAISKHIITKMSDLDKTALIDLYGPASSENEQRQIANENTVPKSDQNQQNNTNTSTLTLSFNKKFNGDLLSTNSINSNLNQNDTSKKESADENISKNQENTTSSTTPFEFKRMTPLFEFPSQKNLLSNK